MSAQTDFDVLDLDDKTQTVRCKLCSWSISGKDAPTSGRGAIAHVAVHHPDFLNQLSAQTERELAALE